MRSILWARRVSRSAAAKGAVAPLVAQRGKRPEMRSKRAPITLIAGTGRPMRRPRAARAGRRRFRVGGAEFAEAARGEGRQPQSSRGPVLPTAQQPVEVARNEILLIESCLVQVSFAHARVGGDQC